MRTATNWVFRVLLLLPPVLLLFLAVPRIQSGYALDAVFPIPVYAVLGVQLPRETNRAAAEVLSLANKADGSTLLQTAELSSLAGEPPSAVADLLREGLSRSPWSTRGWTLLAEQLEQQNPQLAGDALAHSMMLGPYEFYLAEQIGRAHV